MATVTIVQRVLPHYRISLVERLREELARRAITLNLLYGQERPGTVPRTVKLDAPWASMTTNRYFTLGSAEVVWQPCVSDLRGSDLIIVEQSNRLLLNLWLQARRKLTRSKIAFWGHGRNLQSRDQNGLSEQWKRMLLRQVDWWFAYTEMSKQIVVGAGFPSNQVTVLNNSIDSEPLQRGMQRLGKAETSQLAKGLGCRGDNVAIFCGSLYPDKRLGFLLEAAIKIRERCLDFELLIVGDGPQRSMIEDAAAKHEWIRYAGPRVAEDLAVYLRASKVLLMPGLVGLAIVDSFVAQCPIVTTHYPFHSPEIAYLEPQINGVVTRDNVNEYADAVVALLRDPAGLAVLQRGCERSALRFSLAAMVQNFADGIASCLASS